MKQVITFTFIIILTLCICIPVLNNLANLNSRLVAVENSFSTCDLGSDFSVSAENTLFKSSINDTLYDDDLTIYLNSLLNNLIY